MLRRLIVICLLTIGLGSIGAESGEAAVISRQNPYRSFNIHGVNYASMRWERAHRGRTNQHQSSLRSQKTGTSRSGFRVRFFKARRP